MVVDLLSDPAADRIFGALADATRRDILARAAQHEQSVSELAGQYAMSFAAVQKHVAVLERATLVTKEKRGREQIVHANTETLRRAQELLGQYEQIWIARMDRIADMLAETPSPPTSASHQKPRPTSRTSQQKPKPTPGASRQKPKPAPRRSQ